MKYLTFKSLLFLLAMFYSGTAFAYGEEYFYDYDRHLRFTLYPTTKQADVGIAGTSRRSAMLTSLSEEAFVNYWETVVVPETVEYGGETYTVTGVAQNAFSWTELVYKVVLPSTITHIDSEAFAMCSNMTTINMPDNVTTIGGSAFEYCKSLENFNMPANLETIGSLAFRDCIKLSEVRIPASCKSIADEAFTWCIGLKTIYIEDSAAPLQLGHAYLLSNDWEYGDGTYSKAHDRGLFSDTHPEYVYIGRNLSYRVWNGGAYHPFIGYNNFAVTNKAYSHIDRLEFGPMVTECPDYFFECATSLKELVLPEGLQRIGKYAFYMSSFKQITIPASCTTIDDYAFSSVGAPTKLIVHATVPPATKSHTFGGVTLPERTVWACVPNGCGEIYRNNAGWLSIPIIDESGDKIAINVKTPGSLSSRLLAKVYKLNDVSSLTLTGTLNDQDWECVKQCTNMFSIDMRGVTNTEFPQECFQKKPILTKVVFPDNLVRIPEEAFQDCKSLTTISIPNTIKEIGYYAFYRVPIEELSIDADDLTIGNTAFCQSALKRVHIGGHGLTLGKYVFEFCAELEEVTLPEDLKELPERTFYGTALSHFDFPKTIEIIGDYCFRGSLFKEISLPPSVKSLGKNCFVGSTALEEIVLPDGIKNIKERSFYDCTNLMSVHLPEEIETIEKDAFAGCTSLREIDLPNKLKVIGDYAFGGCPFEEIEIPESVIECASAFDYYGYAGLKRVYVSWQIPPVHTRSAYSEPKNIDLYVPINTAGLYMSDKFFKTFRIHEYGKFTQHVNGQGTVYVNSEEKLPGKDFLRFSPYTDLTIKVVPEDGLNISECTLNGINILPQLNAEGEYVIEEADEDYTLNVTFGTPKIFVSSLTLDTHTLELTEGESTRIIVDIKPANADNKELEWTTTNAEVATVKADGTITAHQPGNACIIVKTTDGTDLRDECLVTVVEDIHKVLSLDDANNFDNAIERQYGQIDYTRFCHAKLWDPLYLPFAVPCEALMNDMEVFRINGFHQYDDDEDGLIDRNVLEAIHVKEGVLQPNYPYLVRPFRTGEYTISAYDTVLFPAVENSYDCSTMDTRFIFTGNYRETECSSLGDAGVYVLTDGTIRFADSDNVLPPYRWYLRVEDRRNDFNHQPNNTMARISCILIVTDEEGVITSNEDIDLHVLPSQTYTIDGRKQSDQNLPSGLYVVGGRKSIIRR